jgi:hypothetical protein
MVSRAQSLGCELIKGNPTGKVIVYPSAVVTGTKSSPVVFPDDTGQATSTEIATALATATTDETSYATAIATANANITTLVSGMAPLITQGKADIATLATSTDPLAPIVSRVIEGSLALAQGLADVTVSLQLISVASISQTGV